jgi:DNA polymerase (family 10)
MPSFSNEKVAEILRGVSAAYQIKGIGNQFQIRAYDNAATSVEHATESIYELWKEKSLDKVPGIGAHLGMYLDELFKTGKARHFSDVTKGIPEAALSFLNIPGIGPKTAYKLAVEGKASSIADLKERIKSGKLLRAGFSAKTIANIARGISQLEGLRKRLLISDAWDIANGLIAQLKKDSSVLEAYPLGSLRRMVATIGDIDLAASTTDPEKTLETFVSLAEVKEVLGKGEDKSSVILKNGLQIDLMVSKPASFGSLLQHFTGGKAHNIHFRKLALSKGLSVSEEGVKNIKTGKVTPCKTEEEVYGFLKMQTPPPEIREDTGEIEAALKHELPELVRQQNIQGDLHTHTEYSDGMVTLQEMMDAAKHQGYKYCASTDHSYPNMDYQKRLNDIEKYNYSHKRFRVIKGLEVNINSENSLQAPDKVLALHEFNIASIHSSFSQTEEELTERVLTSLKHPLISMIGHPTGRILNERQGYSLDWEKVFNAAKEYDKVLEINGFPNRSDLPDPLIREAVKRKIKVAINTDSHRTMHLHSMKFGIGLARRGWTTPDLVINTWPLLKLLDYLKRVRMKG